MATVLSEQYNGVVPGAGDGGSLKVLIGSYTFATAASSGDIVKMFKMPLGFTPLFGTLTGADIDTGTEALELDVGITGDTDKYLNSGVITGDAGEPDEKLTVGILLPLQGDLMTVKPTTLTVETDCIVTVVAAANAGGTGTITVMLCGVYNDPRV